MNKYAGTQSEKNLMTAFAGESEARKCGHQVFLALGTSILVHNILLIHSLRFILN